MLTQGSPCAQVQGRLSMDRGTGDNGRRDDRKTTPAQAPPPRLCPAAGTSLFSSKPPLSALCFSFAPCNSVPRGLWGCECLSLCAVPSQEQAQGHSAASEP